jgi:UDP-N-acetyl-D-mannosaminuronate dehydrogenase
LKTIKEAEIYENARNGLQYITTVFINQLAAAYQGINIRSMTKYLLENIELNESHLCIGAGGYKMPYFIQSILEGSENPSALSLIQEVHKINLSLIITYADAIKKRGINSVAILGLSVKGNQKSIDFSPSVILAEYFSSVGITVYIDDPLYSKKELLEILPRCQVFDILADKVIVGALFIMNDHNKFKYITQKDINELGLDTIPVIIDNVPLFSNYRFGRSTIYHAIGDGRIGIL